MSTEIERRPDRTPVPDMGVRQESWAAGLMAWAAAAQKAHDIACILSETSFVPKSMAHRPGDVTGAILTSMELNMPIMWGLSNIDVVDGSPAIRAKGMRGLLLHHGHEIWVEESTATRAVVCARHKGSQRVERSKWDLDRAKKAELLGKKNWRLYPQDMLLNRATAEAARLAAPDVMIGAAAYTAEELSDGDGDVNDGAAPAEPAPERKRRTAQRKPPVAPVDESALPADIPAPDAADERPPVVSEAQAAATMEAAGFEVVDVIDTMEDPPEPTAEMVFADTCDITMPHDTRKSAPDGCPPNCPTRLAAESTDQADQAEPVELMTDAQRRRMGVEMRRVGLVETDERLAYVGRVIGREVLTTNEITVGEASRVITALTEEGLDRVETRYDQNEGDQ